MPSIEPSSLILSVGVAATAVLLAAWQILERSRRPDPAGSDDLRYYLWQDVRRGVVALIMLAISAGVFFGSRMSPRVADRPNFLFIVIWADVLGLVVSLLVLALADWKATHRYGVRHRKAIRDEALQILRDGLVHPDVIQALADESGSPTVQPDSGPDIRG